ncbi:MAG TPA: hypothetical protein VFV27_07595 [Nevskiaceae bacterium]|nr:hypothetical protein [Nevskiaceae bacterium]
MSRSTIWRRGALGLALLGAGAVQAQEAVSTCLLDDEKKVCVALQAAPADRLQPSGVPGGSADTYVVYDAVVTNIDEQSSRNLFVRFDLTAGSSVTGIESGPFGSCTVSGTRVHCLYDKLRANGAAEISLEVRLPDYNPDPVTGTQVPAEMVNVVTFGYQGRTAMLRRSIALDPSGFSYIPPFAEVTLVTAPETANPADQTSAATPLFAKMKVPVADFPRLARLEIIDDGPDQSAVCLGGIYLDLLGDGGPYVCRDTANPRRWVQAGLEGSYPSDPIQLTVITDASRVPATQLPPSLLAPTGTPAFALFYQAGEAPIRAYARRCQDAAEPCLSQVTRYGNGDWSATLFKRTLADTPGDGTWVLPLSPAFEMPDGQVGSFGLLPIEPPVGNIR